MVSFYCVKCRAKKEIDDDQVEDVTMKNGKAAKKSKCPDCDTGVFRIGG